MSLTYYNTEFRKKSKDKTLRDKIQLEIDQRLRQEKELNEKENEELLEHFKKKEEFDQFKKSQNSDFYVKIKKYKEMQSDNIKKQIKDINNRNKELIKKLNEKDEEIRRRRDEILYQEGRKLSSIRNKSRKAMQQSHDNVLKEKRKFEHIRLDTQEKVKKKGKYKYDK